MALKRRRRRVPVIWYLYEIAGGMFARRPIGAPVQQPGFAGAPFALSAWCESETEESRHRRPRYKPLE
jgi:hypothetical protein